LTAPVSSATSTPSGAHSDHRLPRADVALQQPLHRRRLRKVEVDLRDRTLLVLRQRERQHLAVARDQLARLRERHGDRIRVAEPCDDELQRDELVEREPAARLLRLRLVGREVQRRERVCVRRHLELCGKGIRQEAAVVRKCAAHELAQPRRRDLLARRMDGREVGGALRLADVVALHLEAVARQLPAQPNVRPRRELLDKPRLVEELRADLPAALVTHGRVHQRAPAAQRPRTRAHYSTFDRDFPLGEPELRDRDLLGG
jgi:hypothetical protein